MARAKNATPTSRVGVGEGEVETFGYLPANETGYAYECELSIIGPEGAKVRISRVKEGHAPDELLSCCTLRNDTWQSVRELLLWAIAERERLAPLATMLHATWADE